MTTKRSRKTLSEQFGAADVSNGAGSFIPDPVETGDPHANRPLDNPALSDAEVAIAPGAGAIPKASMLGALVQMLGDLSPEELKAIIDELGVDLGATPSAGVPDNSVAVNLASLNSSNALREDVASIFSGDQEMLTEENIQKAAVIMEAAINTRLIVERERIKDQLNEENEQKVSALVQTLTETLDSVSTYVAERFIAENKQVVEESIEAVIAQQFMVEAFQLMTKYNVTLPERPLDIVGDLEKQVATLREQLEATKSREIEVFNENLSLKRKNLISEMAAGLTPLQRDRFMQLVESVDTHNNDEFASKASILLESVKERTAAVSAAVGATKTATLLTEGGIASLQSTTSSKASRLAPDLARYLK